MHVPHEEEVARMRVQPKSLTRTVGRGARGFSLVDLLISISVMSLLVAVLMPALSHAREASQRVKCGSNIRQLGLGLQMFSFDNADLMPQSIFRNDSQSQVDGQNTIFLRVDPNAGETVDTTRSDAPTVWDGLGILAQREYADAPNVYYCPSHKGQYPLSKFMEAWNGKPGVIAGNYQYRIPPEATTKLVTQSATKTLIADGMTTKADYNHLTGNNMLKADLSVAWAQDTAGIYMALADNDTDAARSRQGVDNAWNLLDRFGGGSSTMGSTNTGSLLQR